jgi:hypothetical protein
VSGPELRIGDDDREAAVTALGEHYAAGRLTKEEYDERSERAWEARTMSALTPLFADLPRPQSAGRATGPTPPPRPGQGLPRSSQGRPGWWAGGRFLPVLVVLGVLMVLTHLPLFLLVLVAWLVFARMSRHSAWRTQHHAGHHGYGGSSGSRPNGWVR